MDEYGNLSKKLEIGLADFLSPESRRKLIESELSLEQFRSAFGCDYSRETEQILNWLEKGGKRHVIMYGDPAYPSFEGLEKRLPFFLLYEGRLDLYGQKICVMGTRRCNWNGFQEAFRLSMELGVNGISVVSGMAEGCDQSALYGALRASEAGYGVGCCAVLGCGHDVLYPYGTAGLRKRIIETGGAVISRFAPLTPPLKQNFPSRNMILAAMSDACVAVQCPVKSGAMITADYIIQMGKELFVSSAGLGTGVCCSGTRRLFEDGCTLYDDFFRFETTVKSAGDSADGFRYGNVYYQLERNL